MAAHATLFRRLLGSATVCGLCMVALAACSTPLTGTIGDTTSTNAAKPNANGTENNVSDTAKRFVACLTEKGFDAQLSASVLDSSGHGTKDTAELRMLDASGNPVEVGGDSDGASISSDSTSSFQQLYPAAVYTTVDDNGAWVTFQDSSGLAGTPYANKQADYAACEQVNPEFTQPVQGDTQQHQYSDIDKQAALNFAKQARAHGYDWVEDPASDTPTTIMIPKTVSESELRRFFKECPTGGANISFGFGGTPDEFGYDYTKVMEEMLSDGSATSAQ